MTSHSFFPSMPHALNVLTATGLILIAGILGSHLLRRFFPQIPAISCYVLTGLLIGPSVLNLIDTPMLEEISIMVDLALGLVLFELGRRVDYKWLLRERGLLITGVLLSLVTFFALFLLLTQFGVSKLVASMAVSYTHLTLPTTPYV